VNLPPIDTGGVLALRAQILARNAALTPTPAKPADSFASAISAALDGVNRGQAAAGAASDAFERGDSVDIAAVMLARQKASIGFEATLQVRNKLLSAYRDVMSMPV
jgi:flagellar hook-basal body complex protein FliE